MNTAKLFQMLALGELTNLSMAEGPGNTIAQGQQSRIVLYANEALLRLYSRFVLLEREVLLQMHSDLTVYPLRGKYAVTYEPQGAADTVPVRYLRDTPDNPFTDDLLRVISVFNKKGTKLPLNDEEDCESLYTPQATVLQIPCPEHNEQISILYQAKHPTLSGELGQEIILPDVLNSALTSYIAYKVFDHMNTQESVAKAQGFLASYETICIDVVEKDLVNTSLSNSNVRFTMRGWI